MTNFKNKLQKKYLSHFDELMESVSNTNFDAKSASITNKKHIDVICKYTKHLTTNTEADLMDLYSNSILAANKNKNYAEKNILNTTNELLANKKILFAKGFLSCFENLKKNAGHLYSDDSLKKCLVVNCGTRLQIAKDEFENWSEKVNNKNREKTIENENSLSKE